MNTKSVLRWVLLLIVFGSLGVYAWQKSRKNDSSQAQPTATQDTTAATVVVTYFTTDVRCEQCLTIEKLSREAIEAGFPDELESGEVLFRVVNTDRKQHEHFIETYEIAAKTVIVSHQKNGKETEWTNRQDVWLLLDEPSEFYSYVREPVRRYLGKS